MQNGPKNGVVTLIDMKGMSIGHVFKTSLSSIRKCFNILQTGCPFKVRGIHVLNTATFVNIMLGRNCFGLTISANVTNFDFSNHQTVYKGRIS